MPNWTKSMEQTYDFYLVDTATWGNKKLLTTVKTSSINRDNNAETLGSASFDVTDSIGEGYVRTYLKTIQNGVTEQTPLGTYLVQTPSSSFDGLSKSMTMDGYTPLLELKEKKPPIGYFIRGGKDNGANALERAYQLTREHCRAPVIKPVGMINPKHILSYDFVADTDDTWLSYLKDLLNDIQYEFIIDEMGRIGFAPKQTLAALQPVWTYNDDNSSILYPELTMDRDLYGIPNVVEVIYSKGNLTYASRESNIDKSSPVSIPNRGREILYRVTNPELPGGEPSKDQLDRYTKQLLSELSSIEYTVTYTHGYCPVRLGDCVRLNYSRAGLNNVKAKVISQSIGCTPGCPVSETAVFTTKLWEG